MKPIHLTKAPIAEAIVEIGVKLPADVTVSALRSLHKSFSAEYPNEKERKKWEGKLTVFPNETAGSAVNEVDLDGYMFSSVDRRQVVQFRMDGFAFNRLEPYQTWDVLIAEAKKLWHIYAEGTKAAVISRVAVRYLNVMDLPFPLKVDEYLTAPPNVPAEYPGSIASFVTHLQLRDVHSGIKSDVTQAMSAAGDATRTSVFLDIDVSKAHTVPLNQIDLWESLAALRKVKNDIFFGSITEKTGELYR